MRRHEQQRTERRLKQEIVVDADDLERVTIDRCGLGDVFSRGLVALQRNAEAYGLGHVRPVGYRRPGRELAVEFGIFHEFERLADATEARAFQDGFDLVDAAEQWGLDAVWLAELHF